MTDNIKLYQSLLAYFKEDKHSDVLNEVFGTTDFNELLRGYSIANIYNKIQNYLVKELSVGEFVGIKANISEFMNSNPSYDYKITDFPATGSDEDVPLYGYVMEHLENKKAYRVITVVGDRHSGETLCLVTLKYKNIRVSLNEYSEEMRHKLSKFMLGTLSFDETKDYYNEGEKR